MCNQHPVCVFPRSLLGTGGFDLGFERAGMHVVFQCEIDLFCQQILKRHWHHVPLHDDITTLVPTAIPASELWCAGWPCQDLSNANTDRKGLAGERSGLFFTFMENVEIIMLEWIETAQKLGRIIPEPRCRLMSA